MLETLDKCPLCGSTKMGHYMTSRDYSISMETFSIMKCNECSFLFTNPRPDQQSIGHYYQSDTYISHSDKSNSPINVVYKIVRNYTLKQKLNLINTLSDKGKILDYGCGTGYFLNTCSKNGWQAYGVEPDPTARQLALKNTSGTVLTSLDELHEKDFNIVTLWHVLEHVHQLHPIMSQLIAKLSANGKLIVALPNPGSLDAKIYQQHWAAYDLPRHLYHFSKKTFARLAEQHELKLIQTIPMKFDSFYVSMLSEKYRLKSFGLLSAIINGYKSNIYAKKNNEFSSLIYVLTK